ncbi:MULTISPECIES: helix-turn-helix domain-containing protein [Actinomadura]|uniref:XRE family transcriptional regulator n=1 Tax=Actinomadura yumaensis TaxID=111807 RepID=A0ABW2D301_9ACTN|nr:XRE family transcriptional regulator [Actinomadura sp. J1-007]
MKNGSDDIPQVVAQVLKSVRGSYGWSLENVAARAGVGEDAVAALEKGETRPSLELLIAVADALEIPLARLVSDEVEPRMRLIPPERQPALWHGPKGGTGTMLAASDPRLYLEMWKWRLAPGEIREGFPHPQGNREITYVDEGTLTITVNGRRYVVTEGAAAVFVGEWPHSYANEGDTPLVYTVAIADP